MNVNWLSIGNYFKDSFTTEKDSEGNYTGQIKNPQLLLGGMSIVDLALGSAANNMRFGDVTDPLLLEALKAVYGDANQDPLMRAWEAMNGSAMNNATNNIMLLGNKISTGVSDKQSLLQQASNIYSAKYLEKDKFGWDNFIDNSAAFGKGFTKGFEMTGGNWIGGLIGGIVGGVANIGTLIGNNRRINKFNKAMTAALNLSRYDYALAVDNTLNQNTINDLAMAKYGGYINKYDLGGSLNDFNEINAGGTHEQNPYGGVMVRPDASVEQGETITKTPDGEYVFSDRLKLSAEECKKLGVPKNSTYAEASKKLRKEYDEKPNDEIARKGWEQFRDILIQSLEMLKQEIALKEARKQGVNSPKMLGIDPKAMQDMYYNGNPQEEVLLQQGMNPNIQLAFGGMINLFWPGGGLGYPLKVKQDLWQGDYSHNKSWGSAPYTSYWDYRIEPLKFKHLNAPEDDDPELSVELSPLAELGPFLDKNLIDFNKDLELLQSMRKAAELSTNKAIFEDLGYYYNSKGDRIGPKSNNNKEFNPEDLRYAPVVGNLAAAVKNTFTKPDYQYANRLDLMALSINTNIPTSSNYTYMTYNPVDSQRYLNNYNAQANAARLAVMNTTNPNKNAALLAAQYNDLIGRGDLMQSIDLVNKKHYNDVIVRNNAVNAQKNADALNIANANFARQQYLLGLMQQANALRQAEDEGLRAARAQQWSNAFDSLGALGQEVSANNMAESWFRLSKLAPGLTFEEFKKYSNGKGDIELQDDGKYKFVEKG